MNHSEMNRRELLKTALVLPFAAPLVATSQDIAAVTAKFNPHIYCTWHIRLTDQVRFQVLPFQHLDVRVHAGDARTGRVTDYPLVLAGDSESGMRHLSGVHRHSDGELFLKLCRPAHAIASEHRSVIAHYCREAVRQVPTAFPALKYLFQAPVIPPQPCVVQIDTSWQNRLGQRRVEITYSEGPKDSVDFVDCPEWLRDPVGIHADVIRSKMAALKRSLA